MPNLARPKNCQNSTKPQSLTSRQQRLETRASKALHLRNKRWNLEDEKDLNYYNFDHRACYSYHVSKMQECFTFQETQTQNTRRHHTKHGRAEPSFVLKSRGNLTASSLSHARFFITSARLPFSRLRILVEQTQIRVPSQSRNRLPAVISYTRTDVVGVRYDCVCFWSVLYGEREASYGGQRNAMMGSNTVLTGALMVDMKRFEPQPKGGPEIPRRFKAKGLSEGPPKTCWTKQKHRGPGTKERPRCSPERWERISPKAAGDLEFRNVFGRLVMTEPLSQSARFPPLRDASPVPDPLYEYRPAYCCLPSVGADWPPPLRHSLRIPASGNRFHPGALNRRRWLPKPLSFV